MKNPLNKNHSFNQASELIDTLPTIPLKECRVEITSLLNLKVRRLNIKTNKSTV